jgi:hypothetical protein
MAEADRATRLGKPRRSKARAIPEMPTIPSAAKKANGGKQINKYLETSAGDIKSEYPIVITIGTSNHMRSRAYFQLSNEAFEVSQTLILNTHPIKADIR